MCYNFFMTWALKRQLFYVSLLIFFFGGLGFLVGYPYINKAPTCFDGKQNGTETGVDCGGSCVLACSAQVDDLSLLWSRSFEVVPGRYNAVAYLENQNPNTTINNIRYRFRFADRDNVYIGKREGQTSIPPAGKFAIFESAIDMGNSIPVYTTFEFIDTPVWLQVGEEVLRQLRVAVSDIRTDSEDTAPRLYAKIRNNSLFTIPEVDVVAILYDEQGNALSASRTYIEKLGAEQSKDVTFTWPAPMKEQIVTKEIIPMYNVFETRLE